MCLAYPSQQRHTHSLMVVSQRDRRGKKAEKSTVKENETGSETSCMRDREGKKGPSQIRTQQNSSELEAGAKGKATLEDDTVVLLSTHFRGMPPSAGGITGGQCVLDLVGSGGAV